MNEPPWEKRIRRAEELARKLPFAAEILGFYVQIAGFQKDLYAHLLTTRGKSLKEEGNGSLRHALDLPALLPKFPLFLTQVARSARPPLAAFAGDLRQQSSQTWEGLLTSYWEKGGPFEPAADELSTFCARAFLQPYAEYLAHRGEPPLVAARRPICPLCQALPQVGVLRPEGDGAKRSLICSLCATEWDYLRLVCPSCGEEDEKKLCVYTAKEFDHIRIEACETCKTYIATVDLSKNGLAVPLVDELASVPLNLWARENGYTKLQLNLLGM